MRKKFKSKNLKKKNITVKIFWNRQKNKKNVWKNSSEEVLLLDSTLATVDNNSTTQTTHNRVKSTRNAEKNYIAPFSIFDSKIECNRVAVTNSF